MTLEVSGLSKVYGTAVALDDVSFVAHPGETLAVLGQNGAGKSTLVNILAGLTAPSAGSVRLGGQELHVSSPRVALNRGIVLIPQELSCLPAMPVADNIAVGEWGGGKLVYRRKVIASVQPFADLVGLEVDLAEPMGQLSLAQRQMVEIAKALRRRAKVLLLDEPTAVLSDAEASRLFSLLARLRKSGVTMLYISHRLDEVITHTDEVLVLRDGQLVSHRETKLTSRAQIVADMLGEPAPTRSGLFHRDNTTAPAAVHDAEPPSADRPPVLELRSVSHRDRGLRDVSLTIRPSEIVGLFGVRGAGQESLIKTLVGLQPHHTGELVVAGRATRPLRSPRSARQAGIVYVPPERKSQGLILMHSIRSNLTFPELAAFARLNILRSRLEQRRLADAAAELNLRYSHGSQPIQQLSGGNQQKVMLAARIHIRPSLLVIDEPSRGVDVGARREIHNLLSRVARTGTAVLIATSDVEEVVTICDRLLIFRDGYISAELTGTSKTEAAVLDAAGQRLEQV